MHWIPVDSQDSPGNDGIWVAATLDWRKDGVRADRNQSSVGVADKRRSTFKASCADAHRYLSGRAAEYSMLFADEVSVLPTECRALTLTAR